MARKQLGKLLLDAGVIDEHQLQAALAEQRKWGNPLGRTLVEMGLVSEHMMVRGLSHQLNLPSVELEGYVPDSAALEQLDATFCRQNACLPFAYEERGRFLDVAMVDPTDPELFDQVRVKTRCNVRPHIAGPLAINAAIDASYGVPSLPLESPIANSSRHPTGQHSPLIEIESAAMSYRQSRGGRNITGPVHPSVSLYASIDDEGPATEETVKILQAEVNKLRLSLERDERVLRRLMGLLVQKGVCSREELLARINEE